MPTLPHRTLSGNPQVLTSNASGTPVLLNIHGRQRTAGYAMPNGIWQRRMEASRHFLRKPAGIASGKAAMLEAQRLGCKIAKVMDSESGDTYLAPFDVILRYGVAIQRGDWEPQVSLAFGYWHIIRRDGTEVLPTHKQQTEQAAEQMNLFMAVTK